MEHPKHGKEYPEKGFSAAYETFQPSQQCLSVDFERIEWIYDQTRSLGAL